GAHTYAEEASYGVTVTLTDAGGSTTSAINTTFQVADAGLNASARTVSATEGSAFSGIVASFTDADPGGTAADYTATITWGDGPTSPALISPAGGGTFIVTGSHTYLQPGSFAVQVTITDVGGFGPVTSGGVTADVAGIPNAQAAAPPNIQVLYAPQAAG